MKLVIFSIQYYRRLHFFLFSLHTPYWRKVPPVLRHCGRVVLAVVLLYVLLAANRNHSEERAAQHNKSYCFFSVCA